VSGVLPLEPSRLTLAGPAVGVDRHPAAFGAEYVERLAGRIPAEHMRVGLGSAAVTAASAGSGSGRKRRGYSARPTLTYEVGRSPKLLMIRFASGRFETGSVRERMYEPLIPLRSCMTSTNPSVG
jgi:hypothetical protein